MRAGAALVVGLAAVLIASAGRADEHRTLRTPTAFTGIADPNARSAAFFVEAGRVLRHPRCVNCHPDGDRPSQGAGYPHQPPVQRGADGHGIASMRCATCHQKANFDPGRVPGHPEWHLAPLSMAWQHKSLAAICAQLKDPVRNGGKALNEIVEHMAQDSLVGWAWKPGAGREPAPGTQASFGALIKAWADSGAACPTR
jgi:hypothetical protein